MKFTEYIILEKAGSSVDPLGFLSPYSQISSKLFKQFTVLSNHPSYLGLLCNIYSYLEKLDIYPGKPQFAERFRDLEALWGIINSLNGISVLNVTKYNKYDSTVTLAEVKEDRLLYAKLQYGTLGHYSTPARTWGLLDNKGIRLTCFGRELGEKWGMRNGEDFKDLLKKWDGGKSINDMQVNGMDINAFTIQPVATEEEAETWNKVVENYCVKRPVIAPLWQDPLSAKVLATNKEEKQYAGFFEKAATHFDKYDKYGLPMRINMAELFEKLAAFIQFTFEFEYCKRGEIGHDILNDQNKVEKELTRLLPEFAREYLSIPAAPQPLNLFTSIMQKKTYKGLVQCILAHHAIHQRKKGAKAYMDDTGILVNNRVEPQRVSELLEAFSNSNGSFISKVIWRYRRDWHFDRAALWNSYAGRAK